MTKIDADWLTDPRAQTVFRLLNAHGYLAYCVGGCVRNALLNAPVADIDMSTDATPEQVMALAKAAALKVIPTGVEHGTVTLVVDGLPIEVTTFRKDIETDGRRAVVSFSSDIKDDARRRDFTMNALYCDADGVVLDPLGGLPDLQERLVRFIDDADMRIREDYLRILRFFRFHAWYGDHNGGIDTDGLAACADNLDGLSTLSAERVGAEMLKLLSAPDPGASVATMASAGVLNKILPGADVTLLPLVIHNEGQLRPDPIRRLAMLGGVDVAERVRLSKRQEKERCALRDLMGSATSLAEVAYRYDAKMAQSVAILRASLFEQDVPHDVEDQILLGSTAVFPVSANDLMPELTGKALGLALKEKEAEWIASGFTMSKKELLS